MKTHEILRPSARSIIAFLILGTVSMLIGCQGPVENQGRTNEVPPDVRGPVAGRLGSKEYENTTDIMLESMVEVLDELHRDEDGRTVVILDEMRNMTHLPTENLDLFLVQLRGKLNQSGARYQVTFVEDPERARGIPNRVLEDELANDYDDPGRRPHYAMYGDVYAIDESGARYWSIFFRLLDLDPDSTYRNEIVWENSTGYRFAR